MWGIRSVSEARSTSPHPAPAGFCFAATQAGPACIATHGHRARCCRPRRHQTSADQQAQAATIKKLHAEQGQNEKALHQRNLAERFERSRKVAEMHNAEVLGYQAGKAAAMGLTIEQYQQ